VSLRLSVTESCPLRCHYCLPAEGFKYEAGKNLSLLEMTFFVEFLQEEYGLRKVRLTGGEPLIRRDIEGLVEVLAVLGVPDIALTTNGQQLSERAATLKSSGLHRVNVSLDSLVPETFSAITRFGKLERTLDGLGTAQKAGLLPIRINTVVLRGSNDHEAPELVAFALEHGFELRFLEVMPIGAMRDSFDRSFVSSAETRARLAPRFQLEPSVPTGTARNFTARDRDGRVGTVGFISPISEPFCSGCRRLRLTASGDLIGCLGKESRIPLMSALRERNVARLRQAVEQALSMKRSIEAFHGERAMAVIGG
jgi:cyclic pyranopterin phosphate synthase